MNYYSLNKQSAHVDFKMAALNGQAPDKGLYFPEQVPQFSKDFINELPRLTKNEVAFKVIQNYTGTSIPASMLQSICEETLNFNLPLVQLNEHLFVLELFHGPTLSFKDVGARFMSRCLSYFSKSIGKKIVVLVATSGDTGSAVADGFLNREGVEVVILYPSGKVSKVQELQLTTLGNNVKALEIEGNFDDCQSLVKRAFADDCYQQSMFLTSANSINVARWLPQQFFYFLALQQWPHQEAPVFSVPSGNFGNIGAGLLAKKSGLKSGHFIAACNMNDVVSRYLNSGSYSPKNTLHTCSNAMDVGNPSNFVRIQELYENNLSALKTDLSSSNSSDTETIETLKYSLRNYNYLPDPHTAVGIKAFLNYRELNPASKGIVLATAHPLKFSEWIEQNVPQKVEKTEQIKALEKLKKQSVLMPNDYEALKSFLKTL